MSERDDFVEYVLSLMSESMPGLSAQEREKIELQIRQDWGGGRPFIAKRGPMLKKARERVLAQVGTKPDAVVARDNGISRRTLYRYISRERKK